MESIKAASEWFLGAKGMACWDKGGHFGASAMDPGAIQDATLCLESDRRPSVRVCTSSSSMAPMAMGASIHPHIHPRLGA